ncbi:MAG: hypothetical protein HC834_02240 [Rhodospirillales bacterium]|nr:hypothetical protein [Rhodospirillales bacterium]
MPQLPTSCDEVGEDPKVAFVYDHAGMRKRKDSSTFHFYPNQFYTQVGDSSFKHVFIGETRLLSKLQQGGTSIEDIKWFFHPDHLGSTSIVTSEKGELADHIHYFPYGETWLQERPNLPVPYQFSAKEFDPETGFYDFGARHLNPRFSKWMSADPALGEYLGGSPNGGVNAPINLSLYAYGGHSPAVRGDRDGRAFFIPVLIGAWRMGLGRDGHDGL